jgi:hypothetical protein
MVLRVILSRLPLLQLSASLGRQCHSLGSRGGSIAQSGVHMPGPRSSLGSTVCSHRSTEQLPSLSLSWHSGGWVEKGAHVVYGATPACFYFWILLRPTVRAPSPQMQRSIPKFLPTGYLAGAWSTPGCGGGVGFSS